MTRATKSSVCPHDCPSTCALSVEVLDNARIGAVRGADNSYTAGVICNKVSRYAERIHHPDRLTRPLLRTGPKGGRQFRPISWDEALDRIAERFTAVAAKHGSEAVWPFYYAGTMGLVQRDGINRLRNVMRYSRQKMTICTSLPEAGWVAGIGANRGVDSREMARSDLIVVLGRQSGLHPGQRHDPRLPRPQGTRREAGGDRSVSLTRPPRSPTSTWRRGREPTPLWPARSCTSPSATATPTAPICATTRIARTRWRRI